MENDYRITKLHGTLIGDNRIPDLPADEKTKVFSSTNGKTAWVDLPEGGKSVPPTLVLTDVSGDNIGQKTFITEEEKTNLEKGLYNQVFYIDTSIGVPNMYFSNYFPEIYLASFGGFFIYAGTVDIKEGGGMPTLNPTHIYGYTIDIAEKDSSGNYPITITRSDEFPLASQGGGNSLTLKLVDAEDGNVRTSITEEEKNNLEAGKYGFISYYDESWGDAAEYMLMFPQLLGCFQGIYFALIYNVSVPNNVPSISGFLVYSIEIGEKNSDGTYPLTIEKAIEVPFGGGGGGAIQEIEAIKSTEADAEANQYTLSSTPTSPMYMMKVKNDDGSYSRFTMILQSLGTSTELYFGCKIVSFFDTNTCVYAYSTGNIAILTNQCYLPPEIKDGDVGKVLVAGGNGYVLEDLPSSLPTIYDSNIGDYLTVNSSKQAVWGKQLKEVPEASQADIGKYLVVGDNQKAIWQNLPESTSTTIRRW